jgi:hypothetical protein
VRPPVPADGGSWVTATGADHARTKRSDRETPPASRPHSPQRYGCNRPPQLFSWRLSATGACHMMMAAAKDFIYLGGKHPATHALNRESTHYPIVHLTAERGWLVRLGGQNDPLYCSLRDGPVAHLAAHAASSQMPSSSAYALSTSKQAISKSCSKQADAKGLHGKARRAFRAKCKRHGGKPT